MKLPILFLTLTTLATSHSPPIIPRDTPVSTILTTIATYSIATSTLNEAVQTSPDSQTLMVPAFQAVTSSLASGISSIKSNPGQLSLIDSLPVIQAFQSLTPLVAQMVNNVIPAKTALVGAGMGPFVLDQFTQQRDAAKVLAGLVNGGVAEKMKDVVTIITGRLVDTMEGAVSEFADQTGGTAV